ncbi:exo-alpha-sialidase [Blastococcus sp. TBT05-19]|uniref:WD40/YVTN/BNR-like repeat-containing protein n=1 Tax=Blastococcus sp. TBT05-19 TaxID=2250581 RepID=UPI000DEBE14A|nr:sialidase family protein [Blastococcus sp. TBT05-19]RBY94613.1 exo-alpha-sialidase [Blastococcus sp. TBT05-19]
MTDLLAIGTRKGLWLARSEDDRRSWTLDGPHLLAQEVAAVCVDTRRPTPRLLAGIQYGHWGPTVMWSDDLGGTWNETDSGAIRFPEDTGAALERVWQLRPDSAGRPDVVWAGCEPHSLWRSTDGGCSFTLVRGHWDHPHRPEWQPGGGGGAVHTILPDPASDRVTIAMSGGGVYVSDDGGARWEPRNRGISAVFMPEPAPEYGQCVHKVAVDAAGPDTMVAQNHFGVFRTEDAGRHWSSIAGGLPADFGFPIATSPSTPGTAWVVPLVADMQRVPPGGRLRVQRTRDAGATWTEGGEGLPDAAWTAVMRDAFCVDEGDPTGVYLGTRDGCVYASADEGDSFTLVADHLPDVLVVRAVRLP